MIAWNFPNRLSKNSHPRESIRREISGSPLIMGPKIPKIGMRHGRVSQILVGTKLEAYHSMTLPHSPGLNIILSDTRINNKIARNHCKNSFSLKKHSSPNLRINSDNSKLI